MVVLRKSCQENNFCVSQSAVLGFVINFNLQIIYHYRDKAVLHSITVEAIIQILLPSFKIFFSRILRCFVISDKNIVTLFMPCMGVTHPKR